MNPIIWFAENLHIDFFIVLIVIASGLFQNKYVSAWEIVKNKSTASAYRTLIFSALFSAIYLFLLNPGKDTFANYFVSYVTATSFYEIILKPITNWMKKDKV